MAIDELIHEVAAASTWLPRIGFPCHKFVRRFVDRHDEIRIMRSQVLDVSHYEASTEERVCEYFRHLEEAVEMLPANRVWNCDETGFTTQGRTSPWVMCPAGMRANVVQSADRDNVSLIVYISAAGDALEPMLIFQEMRK